MPTCTFIVFQAPETGQIGEEFDLKVTFKNPLQEKLTGGGFHIEAPGIIRSHHIKHKSV